LHNTKENLYLCIVNRKSDLHKPNKRFAAHNIMKKLLLLLAITIFSLSSMAMGFPNNSYSQQKALYKNSKKVALKTPLQTIEVEIKDTFQQLKNEQENIQKSFVEMVVNYVIHFFGEKVFEQKTSVSNDGFNKISVESVAVRKDFVYYLIG
jgi:hypothetical protein